MEVSFSAELEAKLARLATRWGRDSQALVVEAVERLVDCNEWFQARVEKGLAAEEAQEIDRDGENTQPFDVGEIAGSEVDVRMNEALLHEGESPGFISFLNIDQ